MSHPQVLTVSALTKIIKGHMESAFPFVWVRGQVTNISRPSSGHVYLTLRDENATLAAVWFKQHHHTATHFDPLTGEVYEQGPKQSLAASLINGKEIICAGRLTVYEPRGSYQLIIELAEDVGLGKLQAEFDMLREKLAQKGYFSLERKRALPASPSRIAVITSPKGAAIHDFLRIAEARGTGATIYVYPVTVQGEHAAEQISAAIQRICAENAHQPAENSVQAIALVRGGGSLEDLHAFNTEKVAQAVYQSTIPIIAGVGHEVDFTLADLTADMRAATPSHAAQILWPEKQEQLHKVSLLHNALEQQYLTCLRRHKQQLHTMHSALDWLSPQNRLRNWQERLSYTLNQMHRSHAVVIQQKQSQLYAVQVALQRSPQERISFHMQQLAHLRSTLHTRAVRSMEVQRLLVLGLHQRISKPPVALQYKQELLTQLESQLTSQGQQRLDMAARQLENLNLRLEAVNPLSPLQRGYAMVRHNGSIVSSIAQVQQGSTLHITLHDGTISTEVTGTHPHEK